MSYCCFIFILATRKIWNRLWQVPFERTDWINWSERSQQTFKRQNWADQMLAAHARVVTRFLKRRISFIFPWGNTIFSYFSVCFSYIFFCWLNYMWLSVSLCNIVKTSLLIFLYFCIDCQFNFRSWQTKRFLKRTSSSFETKLQIAIANCSFFIWCSWAKWIPNSNTHCAIWSPRLTRCATSCRRV